MQDMEKWAKTLNAQKAAARDGFKFSFSVGQPKITERESATADAGFAILEKVGVSSPHSLSAFPSLTPLYVFCPNCTQVYLGAL